MRILAIDPGGTTGIVYVEWDGQAEPTLLDFAEVLFEDMPCWMYGCLKDNPVDLIVYERFTISMETVKKNAPPEGLYNIGGVKYLAKLFRIPLREQGRNDAKTAYSNERIKHYGVKGDHAKDALRHALLATHSQEVYRMCTDTDTTGSPDGKRQESNQEV